MRRRRFLGILVATALLAPGASPAAATPPPQPALDRALLQELLTGLHTAGMPGAFAEVRDGRHTARVAAGVADVHTGRPVRPGLRHRVGSVTKSFVATTVLQLVGEGRVGLDAPIGRYLPTVVPGPTGRDVTVRMLLNHTSGIGDYDEVLFATVEQIEEMQTRTFAPAELVALGLALPPTNAPGERWAYSNTNYVLLGMLIQRVTGRGLATEIERRILRPLGLRHSYFPGTGPRIRGPHSAAYVPWTDGQLRDFSVANMSWAWAVGDLVSTPADLNRFYRALLTGRLLSRALLTEMTTTVPMDPGDPQAGGYGLGLLWFATPCGRLWGHNGRVLGHETLSLHSADGRRQLTLAENMNFYAPPDQVTPIDVARGAFLSAALCGTPPDATRTAGQPLHLPLPSPVDLPPIH